MVFTLLEGYERLNLVCTSIAMQPITPEANFAEPFEGRGPSSHLLFPVAKVSPLLSQSASILLALLFRLFVCL